MKPYLSLIGRVWRQHWIAWLAISSGFVVLYYGGLLLVTMLRFGEIPNYVEFYNIPKTYQMILEGTPSLLDAIPILVDESWFETGFKNPYYYGIATWSYMLIPPKMILVFLTGALMATIVILAMAERQSACTPLPTRAYATAGLGSALVGLTSATLTWVVCCATPSWVVGLAMLGMSVSVALWLEPFGVVLMLAGFAIVIAIIVKQLRHLAMQTVPLAQVRN